jgi:membrane protease subunit (stomatin/prohibitin family)
MDDGAPGGGAANDPYGGLNIDPNMDPELAEAIRISLEEAKAAEQAANPSNANESRP